MFWLRKRINHKLNPLHIYCRLCDFIWCYSKWWDKHVLGKKPDKEYFDQATKLIRKRQRLEREKERLITRQKGEKKL